MLVMLLNRGYYEQNMWYECKKCEMHTVSIIISFMYNFVVRLIVRAAVHNLF
jgi:hypothetical protein